MLVIGTGYTIYALSQLLQPARWYHTPAYRNLLIVMPAQAWGGVFAAISALLLAAVWRHGSRWLSLVAVTVAMAVTFGWSVAFVIRWASSPNTTPETWVSWFVNLYLLVRAWALLDYSEVTLARQPRNGGHDGESR
jgi:ABC-type phosphate/phosphonate transport system permease subunit